MRRDVTSVVGLAGLTVSPAVAATHSPSVQGQGSSHRSEGCRQWRIDEPQRAGSSSDHAAVLPQACVLASKLIGLPGCIRMPARHGMER